jgi:hypothetical protein
MVPGQARRRVPARRSIPFIESVEDLRRPLEAQPGLADPDGADERQQAHVGVKQLLSHLLHLPCAADKGRGLRVEVGGPSAVGIGTGGGRACCSFEADAVSLRQPEDFGEALRGVSVGSSSLATFEEADGIRVQSGPFGQVLLGKTRGVSVLAQQIPETQMPTSVHRKISLESMLRDALAASLWHARMIARRQILPEIDRILILSGRSSGLSVESSRPAAHDEA